MSQAPLPLLTSASVVFKKRCDGEYVSPITANYIDTPFKLKSNNANMQKHQPTVLGDLIWDRLVGLFSFFFFFYSIFCLENRVPVMGIHPYFWKMTVIFQK